MKYLLVIVCCFLSFVKTTAQEGKLFYNQLFAPQEGLINRLEKDCRQEICLNGLWDFQGIALPAGFKQGSGFAPALPLPNDRDWDKTPIKIPSPWNVNAFARYNMEGPDHRDFPSYPEYWENIAIAWMKKIIQIPNDWTDKQIRLHFEAVAGYAEIYVKGNKVAENFDIFLPFEVDISHLVNAGEKIEILVGVRKQSLFEDNSTLGRRIIPAGSMWGSFIAGIWQDIYLIALPKIHISDIYIKPLVSKQLLELNISIDNSSGKEETLQLEGNIREWLNRAGTDVNSAPVPNWDLAENSAINIPSQKINLKNGTNTITVQIPVYEGDLNYWTPEHPNLYGLTLNLNGKKQTRIDTKYERFGWREWTFQGDKQCLNGRPYELRGDSWHFMGIPQMTRRYAWAWFSAIKAANGNAVRPHAQIYPRFYLDVADEMGICILNETAIWASDGGPKMDSPLFWENCREHIRRFVLRDRNHASVFGWSISNENRPVILNVFKKPELMPFQRQAWNDWKAIVSTGDPVRPWISSDGEEDGEGALPVTMGHYGDNHTMHEWKSLGKPWGVGEHSMAYYGTPRQVAKYNGERAYESMQGRMEGLANEAYHLIAGQRELSASYVSVFNIVWYGLKPLAFGKKDLTTSPSVENDGIFFADYKEGIPGVQPERLGPYSSTLNPGYDPNLPLYETWPMFDAIRAANAPDAPAWSEWQKPELPAQKAIIEPEKQYSDILFIGKPDSELKQILSEQGLEFAEKCQSPQKAIYIVDGSAILDKSLAENLKKQAGKGADIWIWGITPETLSSFNLLLSNHLNLEARESSSFIPNDKSWMQGLHNSDFYFCEIQKENASEYGLTGDWVENGEILLNACNTDWRQWNHRPEEIKIASVLRSEREKKGAAPVFIRYRDKNNCFYISSLFRFAESNKGNKTLAAILKNAGIPVDSAKVLNSELSLDASGTVSKPLKDFWVWSPRSLENLLIEPDMPELHLSLTEGAANKIILNERLLNKLENIPLQQGWNHFSIETERPVTLRFQCSNHAEFLPQLKLSVYKSES
ncbi:MAG: glycoside hydrolase family 2 [Candidatus Symbiothrix sp.]|nr:glycoside hydrolase family 2 [Candidatus Symbiothrix sp.]